MWYPKHGSLFYGLLPRQNKTQTTLYYTQEKNTPISQPTPKLTKRANHHDTFAFSVYAGQRATSGCRRPIMQINHFIHGLAASKHSRNGEWVKCVLAFSSFCGVVK